MSRYWPDFYEDKVPHRKYAYDNDGLIITEHGEILKYETWDQLKQIIYDHDLILLSKNLLRYATIGAINDPSTIIYASETTHIYMYSIRYTSSNYTEKKIRCIAPTDSWMDHIEDSSQPALPQILRQVMDYCGVGDRATPSSLGRGIGRSIYQLFYLPSHRKVPRILEDHLREYAPVERCQSIETDWHSKEAWEYDIDSAYIMGLQSLPVGQVYSVFDDDMNDHDEMGTWFRWCQIYIPKRVALSPLHRITKDGVSYPTTPQVFGSWLWKEQAELAKQLGIVVVPSIGWMWEQLSTEQKYVVEKFIELKENASPTIKKYVKKSLLSYVGRFAMKTDSWRMVGYFDPDDVENYRPVIDPDKTVIERSRFTNYFLMRLSPNRGGHIHWQRYIVQKTNNAIYNIGNLNPGLIAINFDSLINSSPLSTIPNGMKMTKLTNVTIPYQRAIISDQKIRLPGIKT